MAAASPLPSDFSDSYVELANQLADAAAKVTTKYFRYGAATRRGGSP